MTGSEQVLIHNWCQQYPSHSVGDLKFGADGMLYASSGDGASYDFPDIGQTNGNPCGDPANEGGALRSQDIRTTADPAQLDGTVLRLDPLTGAAAPGNPNSGSADANARRIVATGFRNPFRMTMRPGHQRGVAHRHGVEQLRRDQPGSDQQHGEPRLALLRGQRPVRRLRRTTPTRTTTRSFRARSASPPPAPRRRVSRSTRPAEARSRPSTPVRCSTPTPPASASGR